jgi:hypothetical protein
MTCRACRRLVVIVNRAETVSKYERVLYSRKGSVHTETFLSCMLSTLCITLV